MVVVVTFGILIARAAIAEFVPLQQPGLFEQFDGAVDGCQRNPRVQLGRAGVEFFDIGMILGLADHPGHGAALVGHAQALGLAPGDHAGDDGGDVVWHGDPFFDAALVESGACR